MKAIARLFVVGALVLAGLLPAGAANAHSSKFDFQCQIPRIGNGACTGDRADVGKGHYVRVTNVSSGGQRVIFKLYTVPRHRLLATSVPARPGQKVFIWRNDTGHRVRVQFEADSPTLARVVCNARAHITHR
jgi:hypothetical protein